MYRKILILFTLTVLSIIMINQSVSATTVFVDEPPIYEGGLWHKAEGNRVYVFMRYTRNETVIETGNFPAGVADYHIEADEYATNEQGFDYSLYTYWPVDFHYDLSFPNTQNQLSATIENPNPEVYDTFKVEIVSNMTAGYTRWAVGPPEFKEVKTYNTAVDKIKIDLHPTVYQQEDCDYDRSYIDMTINGEKVLSSRMLDSTGAASCGTTANPNYEDINFGVRMYWETSTTGSEIDPGSSTDPWNQLPETTGSPEDPFGDWGTVSNIKVNNNRISFDLEYLGTTHPVLPFSVQGDLDFINKSNDILYYTDPSTGDRMLYFNFGETLDSALLAAKTFNDVSVWKGEALWNLTQNEIKVTDVLTVYNYIPEVDSNGNIYSYFYMPDVPIDNLISVSAVVAYRYWDNSILGLVGEKEPGEIQYKTVAAVKGESNSVNPTWVEKTYTGAYIAGGLVAAGTAAGVVPVYGWAVSVSCFLVAGVLHVSDINEWWAYDVEQIEHVIPSIALTNEINSYISGFNSEHQFNANTDKLYKLHLGTLDRSKDVEILDSLSNVTQVVWETDGEIFLLEEENIDDIWFGPGTLEPDTSQFDADMETLIWVAVGITGVYMFSKMRLDKKPGLLLLIVGAAVYILMKVGLIG